MTLPFKKPSWENAQKLEINHWEDTKSIINNKDFDNFLQSRGSRIKSLLDKHNYVKFDSIIDIGCGACPVGHFLNYENLKLNDSLLDYYEKEFPKRFNFKYDSSNLKIEELINKKEKYDLVICRNMLDHVDNLETTLKNIKKLLTKKGIIYLGQNTFSGLFYLWKSIYKDPEHPYTFKHKKFEKLLSKYDFKIIYKLYDDPYYLETFSMFEEGGFLKTKIRNFLIKNMQYHFDEYILT